MLVRWIAARLQKRLGQAPAVALLGARQVGKSTLARAIAQTRPAVYLDLESAEDQFKLRDPAAFLRAHSDKLVILDEVQRSPEIFTQLRGLIDANSYRGQRYGQYLLLGSASMALLRQSSESLAGRISYLGMSGLNALEVDARNRLWLRGGFPNSYLAADDDTAMDWLEDLLRTYLERDVPQMGFRVPADRLRRLWTMLAHLQGESINVSKLAANLEVQRATINHYIDILVDLLLLRRLQPWHSNVKKRLVKSPRYYVRDSGILHRLLGINSYDALLSNPILGKSWEGFALENLHSVLPLRAESYFYRTAAGAEVDLVVKMPSAELWAIEIKHGSTPSLSKHYRQTCADIGAARRYIVYGGDDEFPIGDDIRVISLPKMMQLLASG